MLVPAQTPPALEVSVTPSKAGSEAVPNPVTLKLSLTGELSGQALTVYFPQGLRISNTGLKTCAAGDAGVRSGKCAKAKAGQGSITTADGEERALKAFVGAEDLVFRAGDDVLRGKLSQAAAPYTAKMRIKLPQALRTLTALELTMKARSGANSLFATRGCPLPFKTTFGASTLAAEAVCA